jgi:hypothetical protein
MNRPIPTKVHAIEDYMTSTTLPIMSRKLGVMPTTRNILDSVAAVACLQSTMTDYEGGVVRVLPMRAHLAADMVMGGGLLAMALLMRRTPRVDRTMLAGLGAFSVALAMLTRPAPAH